MAKKKIITVKEIREAAQIMQKYKSSKATLEKRIVEDELFWKRCHWQQLRDKDAPKSASGWLFNSIINKHADAMDNYPEAVMMPREASDEESAKTLSSVVPVVMEQNDFRKTYSDVWWYKLKHGTGAYGVFWNGQAEDGKGNVEVKKLDLLNLFWEPGITDIQKSRNLFVCDLVPVDDLKERYKDVDIKGGEQGELQKYVYDDSFDTSDKALVVDWYYKKNGKLHLCKYCEENVLFASENEEGYENGWYEDGLYPVVFDTLYPEDGTPVGFGIVSVCKDAQINIDTLDDTVLDYIKKAANPRYFAKRSAGINKKEFLDTKNAIVEVEGDIDEEKVRQIVLQPLPTSVLNMRAEKINELKETSGNMDFAQGNTSKGVTSGAAIATLQEAGNKLSRDTINMSHEAFKSIVHMVIERMRQFFDITRVYRITQPDEGYEFIEFNNSNIRLQPNGMADGVELFRKPVFDIAVHAQKKNPFSTLSQNETAMNLYNAGFFDPQMAQSTLAALELMTFEGKEKVVRYVQQGATLQNQLMQMQQVNQQLMQQIEALQGGVPAGAAGEASSVPMQNMM